MAQIQIKNPTNNFVATIDESKFGDYQNIKTSAGVINWERVTPVANNPADRKSVV